MIGELNIRASLEQATQTPDGGGGFCENWSVVANVWIAIHVTGGDDAVAADRLQSRTRYRVTLRRRTDVAAGMRLVADGRTLLIHAVLDGQTEYLDLLCEALP